MTTEELEQKEKEFLAEVSTIQQTDASDEESVIGYCSYDINTEPPVLYVKLEAGEYLKNQLYNAFFKSFPNAAPQNR